MIFLGWSEEKDATTPDEKYEVGNDVIYEDKNIVLYAVWKSQTYDLAVNKVDEDGNKLNGAKFKLYKIEEDKEEFIKEFEIVKNGFIKVENLVSGSYMLKEIVAPEGYELDNTEYPILIPENSEITIKNKKIIKYFEVIYDGNGHTEGTLPVDDKKYKEDEDVIVLGKADVQKTGYDFKGWALDKDASDPDYLVGDTFKIKEDTKLYAVWELSKYDLKVFKVDEHNNLLNGAKFRLSKVEEDKKDNIDEIEKREEIEELQNEIDILEKELLDKENIYNENEQLLEEEIKEEEIEKLENVIKENLEEIEKLKENINNKKEKLIEIKEVIENKKEDASEFGEFSEYFEITENGSIIINGLKNGKYILKEVIAPAGYELDKAEYKITIPNIREIKITNRKIISYLEVIYDGNGNTEGIAPIDNNKYIKDDNVIVFGKENIKKLGYEFKGWALDKNAITPIYKEGDKFIINQNTTLYAVWEKEKTTPVEPKDPIEETSKSKKRPKKETKVEEVVLDKNIHISYLKGYPDNNIRPAGNITRAEVAAIFSRLKLNQEDINYALDSRYIDQKNNDWFSKYLNFVTDNNMMEGYEDRSFKPNENITRAEFAVVVSRFGNAQGGESNFEDIKGHWAEKNINAVTSKGWIEGYPDGTYQPEKDITREEVATMVNKMLSRKVDEKGINNLDVKRFLDLHKERWSYYDLVEASNSHEYTRIKDEKMLEDWIKLINKY